MNAVAELFWTHSYDSTTIDQICERAGVRKGSFYHFFEDKAALAQASLAMEWEKYRPTYDAIFSATLPPLERIRRYCESMVQEQVDLQKRHGCVLGCPLCTLGSEISTQDRKLRDQVQEIMAHGLKYLETAIRDAHAAGLIHAPDAAAKAALVHAFQLGLLLQARISNDLKVLGNVCRDTFEILGVTAPPQPARTKPRRKS
jgi:TetR/AcrR family transcriptional repressor of nem operon